MSYSRGPGVYNNNSTHLYNSPYLMSVDKDSNAGRQRDHAIHVMRRNKHYIDDGKNQNSGF